MYTAHKSTLAKLLATENLSVEHQKVPTAMFNLSSRTLTLPIWKDMSSDLYDLLIGHEVGHALYTPAEGWHSEIDTYGAGIKSYLNVLEDVRIERKIKDKFPGIRKNFFAGYQELFDKNFFGVKDYDTSKLRFIDRINLHYKIGSLFAAPFSDEERTYLVRIDALETWDDVAALAVELYELAKSEPEHDFDTMLTKGNTTTDSSISEMDSILDKDSDQLSAVDNSDDDAGNVKETDEDGEENIVSPSDSDTTPTLNDDPVSITDQLFRAKEDEFIDETSREYSYGTLHKFNIKDYVIPMDWVVENMRPTVYSDNYEANVLDYDTVAKEVYTNFRNRNQKYINMMVQEFELRRRASEFARAQVSKTGRLNVDRVWAHKISEDMFVRSTVVPNGKNHGMLLFLDMSGSMANNMHGTIEQLVILMMFCRKVRIPFEVYGFTTAITERSFTELSFPFANEIMNRRRTAARSSNKELVINDDSFYLLQFLSDNCSAGKFNEVIRNLLMCAEAYERFKPHSGKKYFRKSEIMKLHSTPLEECIMIARSIADKFRVKNRIEVLNTIFLTDGDGDNNISIDGLRFRNNHITVTDLETGAVATVKYEPGNSRVKYSQMQTALLNLYQKTTGSRIINFFIADYNPKRIAQNMHNSNEDFNTKWRTEWKQNFFHTKNSFGFNDRFLIPGDKNLNIQQDVLIVETSDNSPKKLQQAFKKFQNAKHINRILLNKIIQAVA